MPVKLVYILSNIDKSFSFEWIASSVNPRKFELSFILLNMGDSYLEKYLLQKNIAVKRISYKGKKDLLFSFLQIFFYLLKNKPSIVHCHLFDASLSGLLAAKLAGVKKRIYTRHHSTSHHVYQPHIVKFDKFINWLSTDIVAISENVKQVLTNKEKVNPDKIHLIHHGFRLDEFENISEERVQTLKNKYRIETHFPVIGIISRYTHWKGIHFIIPAFKDLLNKFPGAYLILANAKGDYKNEIKSLLSGLNQNNFIEIEFEQDLPALYQLFNVFVHVPIDGHSEAFGQTYIEALASGIPAVFTLSGIANEFITDNINALTVGYQNSNQINDAIQLLLHDSELRNHLVRNGKESVREKFGLIKMISLLEKLYEQ